MTDYQGIPIHYCDNHLLVAVKPPNVPSQADVSGDMDMLTLMKDYIKEKYQKPGKAYLGLVHRLDRPVGGLMVFARTSKAAARLCGQMRSRSVGKTYLAVVEGDARDSARLVGTVMQDGRPLDAALSYQCIEKKEGFCLLRIQLETGRKHQIRIQLSEHKLPIWGDMRYGHGKPGAQIALYAAGISFVHPTTKQQLAFSAPPPACFPWTCFKTNDASVE